MNNTFSRFLLVPVAFLASMSVAQAALPASSDMTAVVLAQVQTQAQTQTVAAPASDGEVRRIDKGSSKITLKHGPIKNLDMPPMTMVFQVRDPAMLASLKVGDKVRFDAELVKGAYIVTSIVPAQ